MKKITALTPMISVVTQSKWKLAGPIITMKVIVSTSVTKNSDELMGRYKDCTKSATKQ